MAILSSNELKSFLDEKAAMYERPHFIESDPIQIPHLFTRKEDIEIAGFLAATLAWGQRKTIIKNATFLMEHMDMAPYEFITGFETQDLNAFTNFKHRTFNSADLYTFFGALQRLYREENGLEGALSHYPNHMAKNISHFKSLFFETPHAMRTQKHLSNPLKGSAAKRINMFLRWMVRPAKNRVDFGIWQRLSPSQLYLPLDVHTAGVSRKLGILHRKQDDWKALEELQTNLRKYDPQDPVKYDFALFGLGVFENFTA